MTVRINQKLPNYHVSTICAALEEFGGQKQLYGDVPTILDVPHKKPQFIASLLVKKLEAENPQLSFLITTSFEEVNFVPVFYLSINDKLFWLHTKKKTPAAL